MILYRKGIELREAKAEGRVRVLQEALETAKAEG
jgi:hypothetical protein